MSDRITITVDGVEREVAADQPLIEAIREAGTDTPNFCYHPDLKIAGNCRICLVEVDGPRGPALMISCHLRPRPGMVVNTQETSEKVVKARKGVMEFLLVNHPLDCPICDKAGECKLQEHYMDYGAHDSRLPDEVDKVYKGIPDHRFTDTKGVDRGGKHIDLGPSIVLDQERCILCDRCVRFMRDVADDEQLYIAGRGDHAYLTTFPGEPLEHDYDLNTTDICPVGALTGKHFRFQQRVWFLKKVASIAPDDSLGANITIEYNQERVWRLMPRRNPDVNKSWIHNETRLLYQDLGENRFVGARSKGEPTTLRDGLVAAGQLLKSANRVALVASGHSTTEDNAALLALADALGPKAEVFGGSWLSVGEADGIARSGDPVANRKGLELLGIPDNLDDLAARAAEFDVVLVMNHKLWDIDADKAQALKQIPHRIVLGSWDDETTKAATLALGIRCWAEVRGTMVNCHSRVQMLGACPVCPDQNMEAAWQTLTRISATGCDKPLPFAGLGDVWRSVQERVPAVAGIKYSHIGPQGYVLAEEPVSAEAEA